jgi:hypothetical protein
MRTVFGFGRVLFTFSKIGKIGECKNVKRSPVKKESRAVPDFHKIYAFFKFCIFS